MIVYFVINRLSTKDVNKFNPVDNVYVYYQHVHKHKVYKKIVKLSTVREEIIINIP